MTEIFTIDPKILEQSLEQNTDNGCENTPYDRISTCQDQKNPAKCVAGLIVRGHATMEDLQGIGPTAEFEARVGLALRRINRRQAIGNLIEVIKQHIFPQSSSNGK